MTSKSLFKGGGVRDGLQMRAKMVTKVPKNKGKPKEKVSLRVMATK